MTWYQRRVANSGQAAYIALVGAGSDRPLTAGQRAALRVLKRCVRRNEDPSPRDINANVWLRLPVASMP